MRFNPTTIKGCWLIEPMLHGDDRGSFMETYREDLFNQTIDPTHFIQDNEATSSYGIIRGMHFQKGDHAQAKLIRAVKGVILDVVIDLREHSPTYRQKVEIELSEKNKKQLFIPKGCAHGYAVLSPSATVIYKVDAPYHPEAESGLSPLDPALSIDWPIDKTQQLINTRDLNWPPMQ